MTPESEDRRGGPARAESHDARENGGARGVDALSVYLELLRAGDVGAADRHARGHQERRSELEAVRAAWERIAPLIGRLDGADLSERLATRFGREVDPGISLSGLRSDDEDAGGSDTDSLAGPPTSGPAGEYRERFGRDGLAERRYTKPREIARGGMGSIRRVWDNDLRRELVMKAMLLPRDRTDGLDTRPPDSRLLSRFLEEAQVTSQLDHPGILPVHDIGVDAEGRLFFTMPLVKGVDLGTVIERARAPHDSTTDPAEQWDRTRVLGALTKAMEAVAFAHSHGVVHRDIKPENIMVGRFGETYVMDWGLARILEHHRETRRKPKDTLGAIDELRSRAASAPSAASEPTIQTDRTLDRERAGENATLDGDIIGTPGYMAPEQARGQHERIGPLADVYSFGAILYQLLTGYRPSDDPISRKSGTGLIDRVLQGRPTPIAKLDSSAPEELVAICNKAMRIDPSKRYQSMLELLEDVRASLEGRVVQAYDTSARAMFVKWVRRNLLAATILFTSLVLGATGTGLFIWQLKSSLSIQEQALAEAQRQSERAEIALGEARSSEALAEQQALQAEDARAQAEASRADAVEQSAIAQARLEQLRREQAAALLQGYSANLSAVQASIADDDLTEARRRLAMCPPELRDWEFDHLSQRVDMSLRVHREEDIHPDGVRDFDVAPDGQMASISGNRVHTWDGDVGGTLEHWTIRDESARAPLVRELVLCRFLPDASAIVVLDTHGDVWMVEPGSSDVARVASSEAVGPGSSVVAELSPDGTSLAIASTTPAGPQLALVDLESGAVQAQTVRTEFVEITALAWHPTERALALGLFGVDGRCAFELVDPTLPRIGDPLAVTGVVDDLAFDASGEHLAVCTDAGELIVWRRSDQQIPFYQRSSERSLESTCFGPEGDLVYAGTSNGMVEVWEVSTGRRRLELRGHEDAANVLRYDPLRHLIVSGSRDGSLRSWPPSSGDVVQHVDVGDAQTYDTLFFVDDEGEQLVVGGERSGQVWDAAGLRQTTRFEVAPRTALASVHALPGGRDVVGVVQAGPTARPRWEIQLWSSATGGLPRRRLTGSDGVAHASAVSGLGDLAVAFDPEGSRVGATRVFVYALGGTNTLKANALGPWRALEDQRRPVVALAYDASGRQLACGHADGSLSIWSARSLRRLAVLTPPRVALDQAGSAALKDFAASTIANVAGVSPRAILDSRSESDEHAVAHVAFDPQGRFVAAGGSDGIVRLWDLESRELVRAFVGHEDAITALTFHPDSGRLASGSRDGSLRLWSHELDESLLVLRGHDAGITDACFDPRGRRLASIDSGGSVRVHETEPQIERYSTQRDVERATQSARPAIEQLLNSLARQEVSLSDIFGMQLPGLSAVKLLGSRPATLHDRAWEIVRSPDGEREEYLIALDYARVAALLLPKNAIYQRTLGIAQYRAGFVDEALETLDGETRAGLAPLRPEELSVIALCSLALGQRDDALDLAIEVESMCDDELWSNDMIARAFRDELRAALAR